MIRLAQKSSPVGTERDNLPRSGRSAPAAAARCMPRPHSDELRKKYWLAAAVTGCHGRRYGPGTVEGPAPGARPPAAEGLGRNLTQ
eukprot:756191-Hanusia_phi.AAC.2